MAVISTLFHVQYLLVPRIPNHQRIPIVTVQNYLGIPVLVSLRKAAHNKHYFGIKYWSVSEVSEHIA